MTSEERYKNGKIYTIRYRGDDSLIYVGSTCLPLYKRWYKHKFSCLNENDKRHNIYVYQKIRETKDFENWYIELYEECPCENKEQLLKREGEIIREIGTLNSLIAGRTLDEWKNDNKDKITKTKKDWYDKNKDRIVEKKKAHYEKNKNIILETQKQYREQNKQEINKKQKEKYIVNKDKILEEQKKYRKNNKDKIVKIQEEYRNKNKLILSEKQKEIILCVCGCSISKGNISRHHQSKKHLDLINLNSNENNENL